MAGKPDSSEEKYTNLIELIKENDETAYKELYRLLFAPLCVFALRYVTNREEAKDCVQDIFYKIWRDRENLFIQSSVKSYLLTATRNSCLNIIQKKQSAQTYEQYILNTYDEFRESDLYSITELEELIEKAMEKLPEKLRTIFKMSRIDNLTYKEIAIKQNISIKTVESYIHKSLIILQLELKDYIPILLVLYFIQKNYNFS